MPVFTLVTFPLKILGENDTVPKVTKCGNPSEKMVWPESYKSTL